jgi:signal transduction histidine kinase
MTRRKEIQSVAQALGVSGADAETIGAESQRAGVTIAALVTALVDHGAASAAPLAAASYVDSLRRTQATMVADAAHDLRGPLSSMLGIIQTLRRRPLAPDMTAELLERCENSCHRLELLIADVDTLSRLDAGTITPQREQLDIRAILEEVARVARAPVAIELQDPLPVVRSDHVRVVQILHRLVDNALRYSSSSPGLLAHRADGNLALVVTDDGPGIAPEHLPHLTSRFFQVPNDQQRGRSGLGLAVASELAVALGGSLDAQSTPGQGSRFALELPADSQAPNTR